MSDLCMKRIEVIDPKDRRKYPKCSSWNVVCELPKNHGRLHEGAVKWLEPKGDSE